MTIYPDPNRVSEKADDQLAELRRAWFDQVLTGCKNLTEAIDAITRPETDQAAVAEDVHRMFHDLQGQGTLFGYPMISELSTRFCAYWRGAKGSLGPEAFGVARAHVLAAQFIMERRIEGCGGPTGQAIMAKLATLTHDKT